MATLRSRAWLYVSFFSLVLSGAVWADSQSGLLGYDALVDRLGADAPTGAGVLAGHVEAPDGDGDWAPDPTNSQFSDVTWVYESGNPTGFSGHATTVGRHFYGNVWSIAPDVNTVHVWEVNNWLQSGFLRLGQGSANPPLQTDADVFNASWIGSAGGFDNEILRRVDFAINNQDLLFSVGVGNGDQALGASDRLLSHGYNIISVGRSDGNHHHGTTANTDGPGRMKPEIVAPDGATSWTTGLISSCCAVLLETSRTWPGLQNNPNAVEPEVIKAALMAGATHRPGWTNNPETSGANRGVTTTPLDPVFGADQANVNTSHMILTGLEQDGFSAPPPSGSALNAGWDLDSIQARDARLYRFEIFTEKDEVSILLTWNRHLSSGDFTGTAPLVADFDLELLDENLQPLRGSNGVGVFTDGNIASVSPVDNVEHLFILGLQPGTYFLEVSRNSDGVAGAVDYAVAWFMPPDLGVPAELDSFAVNFGAHTGGTLADLQASDDQYLTTNSQFGFSADAPNITEVQFNFFAANPTPSGVSATIEARLNNPGGTSEVRMKNFAIGGEFQLVHTYSIGQDEFVETIAGLSSVFVNPNNSRSRMRVRQSVVATFSAEGFDTFWDHVQVITFD